MTASIGEVGDEMSWRGVGGEVGVDLGEGITFVIAGLFLCRGEVVGE